ncbi:MAG TPA: hypothetical protein EYP24_01515 [bacterium (Candidatus Stahlbacteria)]|nr:hypothetical protein [Candidatus Stahlbacteria bacterium]
MALLLIITLGVTSAPTKAILASALLPGLGELTMKKKNKAKTFLFAEASIWFLYGSMTLYARKYRTASRSYAAHYAHANINNDSEEYFDLVERYQSADLYNEYVLRDAIDLFPGDYEKQQEYLKEHGIFGDDKWCWDSNDERLHYWYLRRTMRDALRKVSYATGLLIANRIISMIDVAIFTRVEVDCPDGKGIGLKIRF